MKKRMISMLLMLAMMLSIAPAAFAAATVSSGTCGDNVTWTLDDQGTLTISGEGAMEDYMSYGSPWFSVRDSINTLIIRGGVTSIGDYTFSWCKNLKNISIPEGVTDIGRHAFGGCTSLTTVKLPATLISLDHQVFGDCSSLKKVIFTGNAPTFGTYVFNYDNNLTAYYPVGDATWTSSVKKDHGGWGISWVSYLFLDVPANAWFMDQVQWAVDNGITNGVDATNFAPDASCTRNQVVTFLWRAQGCPEPKSTYNPFVDVKESDYFYKAVLWAVENNITNGMDQTHFDPNGKCTRAQVVTFLHRAAGKPAPASTENPFSDVKQDYYTDAVLWAVGEEITKGITSTTFAPDTTCTRAQIVTFLYRAYK